MSRIINGALAVGSFTATGIPGEYTFDNAIFDNQADATGSGAFDLVVGQVLFVPAADINTFASIPGVYHRYKLTSVTALDSTTLSGTMLWDEPGGEVDSPANGVACLLSETTSVHHLAIPPLDDVYSALAPGGTLAAVLSDVRNIVDGLGSGSGTVSSRTLEYLPVAADGQTVFALANLPVGPISLTVNGVRYFAEVADFTLVGSIVTWLDAVFSLETSDVFVVEYSH